MNVKYALKRYSLLISLGSLALIGCHSPSPSLALTTHQLPVRSLQISAAAPQISSESPTFFENRLRGFVYHWFSLFDSNAPYEEFLKRMVLDQSLEFRFPDATLRNEKEFRNWYDGILKNIRVASHTINSVKIQNRGGNEFIVLVDVLWRGVPFKGDSVVFHASQEWHVVVKGNDFNDIRIRKYLVSAAKP